MSANIRAYALPVSGIGGGATFIGANEFWWAETFLTDEAYTIDHVRLHGYKKGTPGTITVSIKATNALTGKPEGADLCSGTYNANRLKIGTAVEDRVWFRVNFAAPANLTADKLYAIIIRANVAGDASNHFLATYASPDVYTDGETFYSIDAGTNWTLSSNMTIIFVTHDSFEPPIPGYVSGDGPAAGGVAMDAYGNIIGGGNPILTIKRLIAAAENTIWYENV